MGKINRVLSKVFYEIGTNAQGGPPTAAFVDALLAEGLKGEQVLIDSVSMRQTQQGSGKGTQRIVGVYIPDGENLYDADFDGTSRVAVVVDLLLRNEDVVRYASYADALVTFLEKIQVGIQRKVINLSFSHANSEKNERVTALLAIEFEPESDGGEKNTVSYI